MTDAAIEWRLERGWWVRLHLGVYLTVPGRDDWWTRAVAAQLATEDSAWSHHTAAFAHGLVTDPPRVVDLMVEHGRRLSAPPAVRLHRRRDADRFVDELHWPWRTTVEETILDVAATASMDQTFALLGRAFAKRLTTDAAVLGRLSLRPRHPTRDLLTTVLGDIAEGAESAMEIRYLRDVERAHGLPRGRRQFSTRRDGSALHDIGYLVERVVVELDGRLGHEGPDARVKDGIRDRRGAAIGWLTIRAFWRDVAGHPCDLAADTGAVLRTRGWPGPVHPCRRRECTIRRRAPG